MKEMGISLDLDDFGTGYSSLLYLKHFPIDRIKIDQSFVAGLGTNWADTAIIASTITLAHSIGVSVVAEGVENPEQLLQLRKMGCEFAQGYLLAKPLPLDELRTWLSERVPEEVSALEPTDLDAFGLPPSVGRDAAADLRDEVADLREQAADLRDVVADGRDLRSDRRDDALDVRDGLADARDDLVEARQTEAHRRHSVERAREAGPATGTTSPE